MKLSDFDYYLPKELIAQYPAKRRDQSRMMVVYRNSGEILHRHFRDFPYFLDEKYLIVYNDSKVTPCRAFGIKKETGCKFEVLFLKKLGNNTWECMVNPKKRAHIGTKIIFSSIEGEVIGFGNEGFVNIKFPKSINIQKFLNKFGHMPLPPYIKSNYTKGYQTVFARKNGSAAAPTAGLHFTKSILNKLNIPFIPVTLHVGAGTFLPLREEEIGKIKLHYEPYSISKNTANKINHIKNIGGKIAAVGTTTTRVLETQGAENGIVTARAGETNLFIYPSWKFKIVDALLTNFHLPKSSLFLLVCAFAGIELIKKAYSEAVQNKYRFFSYGDCMLIIDK